MRYQKSYSFVYMLLVLSTVFAPEEYSVPLKHAFIPLLLMVVFGMSGKGIPVHNLKIRGYFLVCLCWIALMVYSTMTSRVVGWSPNARSFCLLILFFALLYGIAPEERYMNAVKHTYIYATLFCAFWIMLQSVRGFDRQNFMFVTGQKDVNYLAAFMLPGVYMAMRFAFIEKQKQRVVYFLCIVGTFYGILYMQSRAAFITMCVIALLCLGEYMSGTKLSKRKIVVLAFWVVVAAIFVVAVWNIAVFDRLTALESYNDDVRLTIWEAAIEAFTNSPIIGSGLGASNYYARMSTNHDTHNNYIDILGDSGIIGVLLFVLLCLQILRVRKGERLHMFSYFVACMFPMAFINGLQTITFWLPMLLLAHEHMLIQRQSEPEGLQ